MNRIIISTTTVLLLLLLCGCATPSTQETIAQEQLAGDWTAADAGFGEFDQAAGPSEMKCPKGTKPWCVNSTGKESCSCVDDTVVRDRLATLWRR